jgi:hypothetical protein
MYIKFELIWSLISHLSQIHWNSTFKILKLTISATNYTGDELYSLIIYDNTRTNIIQKNHGRRMD